MEINGKEILMVSDVINILTDFFEKNGDAVFVIGNVDSNLNIPITKVNIRYSPECDEYLAIVSVTPSDDFIEK